jgi:predicted MarR family transcription regulator
LKKLAALRLVKTGRAGKEKVISVTDAGRELCLRYREIRERLLVAPVLGTGVDPNRLSDIAAVLRALSGTYDQAAHSAASL